MKKMLVLALALVFILSGAVMAQDGVLDPYEWVPGEIDGSMWNEGGDYYDYSAHIEDDGVVFVNHIDASNPGAYTNLEELDRIGYYLDANNTNDENNQEVVIKVPVEAYIPCFLEMKLTGNQGTTSAISYGPGTTSSNSTVQDGYGYQMTFDNEIGGYLDENWQSLGHGKNVELDPGADIFIGACDIFAVEVISNDNYKYEVSSQALIGQGGAAGQTLPMYMRSDLGAGWITNDFIFNAQNTFTRTRNAGQKLEALHNFKVPFSMNTVHGEYTGEVVFRAVTI